MNKQIATGSRQRDWKLCDLIYLLVGLIFCHIRRSIMSSASSFLAFMEKTDRSRSGINDRDARFFVFDATEREILLSNNATLSQSELIRMFF